MHHIWKSAVLVKSELWFEAPPRNQASEKLWWHMVATRGIKWERDIRRIDGWDAVATQKRQFLFVFLLNSTACPLALVLEEYSFFVCILQRWKHIRLQIRFDWAELACSFFRKLFLPPASIIMSYPDICNTSVVKHDSPSNCWGDFSGFCP